MAKNCRTRGSKFFFPRVRSTPGKKNFDPPGEAIFWDFWAKSPPGLLNKHPTEKNFSPPGGGAGEKIFRPPKAAGKFFFGHPPVSTPPLSQNPCPPMFAIKKNNAQIKECVWECFAYPTSDAKISLRSLQGRLFLNRMNLSH